MQHVNILLPDKEDIKNLIKSANLEVLKETKANHQSQSQEESRYKTRAEIAKKYHISLVTLAKHVKSGLPSFKIGKRRLFDAALVAKYIDQLNSKK